MKREEIFKNTEKGLTVRLKIVPNSSKNDIFFDGDILKIKITAQPIENKANKALVEFLAKKLKIAKSNIQITKGELSKEKTLLIQGLNKEEFFKVINYLGEQVNGE
ncbi:MAG: DUF167 domain-containing protein [Candidatus Gastranaerophilales bacterium]|nr:DUF167 domain-containing protein [Candidatus Gastranaerophilales bacterium]